MIVAVIFHLLNTGGEAFPLGVPKAHSYNFELAAMYVLVLGYFTVSGAGKYSVDEQVLGGEIKVFRVSSTRSLAAAIRRDNERRTRSSSSILKGGLACNLSGAPSEQRSRQAEFTFVAFPHFS